MVGSRLSNSLLDQLDLVGSTALRWDPERSLLEVARLIGASVMDHRYLVPRDRTSASPQTLSAEHGLGAFPWHTDGATWTTPPRFIIMRSIGETRTPTAWLDGRAAMNGAAFDQHLRTGTWLVKGRIPFYTSAIDSTTSSIRFNPDVMSPASPQARLAHTSLANVLHSAPALMHHWTVGEVLVFDNHRILHARPAVRHDDERRLERVLCGSPVGMGF